MPTSIADRHAHAPVAAQRLQAMLHARFGVTLNLGEALDMLGQASNDHPAQRLKALFAPDGIGEHPMFRHEVWRYLSSTGDTTDDYWAWVANGYVEHGMMLPWEQDAHPAVIRARAAGLVALYHEPHGWYITAVGMDQPLDGTPFFHDELAAWVNADDQIAQSVRRALTITPRAWRAMPLEDQVERIHQAMEG